MEYSGKLVNDIPRFCQRRHKVHIAVQLDQAVKYLGNNTVGVGTRLNVGVKIGRGSG